MIRKYPLPVRTIAACLALPLLASTLASASVSTITSNFNGTAIPAGDYVWFNSVINPGTFPSGSSVVHLYVTHATISFTDTNAPHTAYNLAVPDSVITFDAAATSASTSFNTALNEWQTTVPLSYSGNSFLDGLGVQFPAGLGKGINPVSWTADFTTDVVGGSFQWQWAAADYSSFSNDNNALGVKPVDSNTLSSYLNSDHAGTPEAFKAFVTGGARGGGGSNFTGSYSATVAVTPTFVPEPMSTGMIAATSLIGVALVRRRTTAARG